MLSQSIIDELLAQSDDCERLRLLIEHYDNFMRGTDESDRISVASDIIDFALAAYSIAKSAGLAVQPIESRIDASDIRTTLSRVYTYISGVEASLNAFSIMSNVRSSSAKLEALFSKEPLYEFSEGDLDRIQLLINELRDHISNSEDFDDEHRQRILRRLERLQGELHKRISDLDRFWGLIGDAGVALGKFGRDAKPIVDRIREIAEIVWRTQARGERLSSTVPFPQLGKPHEED